MAEGGGQERRRSLRIKIRAPVHSQMFAVLEARLVDLSAMGALVEHVEPIRPGGACELVVEDTPEDQRLRCRIVRSMVTQPQQAAATREIRYQTGVEFVDLKPAQSQFVEALIRRHRGGDGGGSASLGGLHTLLLLL
jgi:hypothetical protein